MVPIFNQTVVSAQMVSSPDCPSGSASNLPRWRGLTALKDSTQLLG